MDPKASLAISDADITYALKILDAFAEAFDRVAAKPALAPQLIQELAENSSLIFDALLAVTRDDCRPVVFDLGKSVLNLVRVCLQNPQKQP